MKNASNLEDEFLILKKIYDEKSQKVQVLNREISKLNEILHKIELQAQLQKSKGLFSKRILLLLLSILILSISIWFFHLISIYLLALFAIVFLRIISNIISKHMVLEEIIVQGLLENLIIKKGMFPLKESTLKEIIFTLGVLFICIFTIKVFE